MVKRMLIDATHPEETRVVVLNGNRLEEFDFESARKKQLKGNIYLAKIARVEPSLQAAFVEYGGNRHGFLSFNEIHPDYYRLPMADREALAREIVRDVEDDEPRPRRDRRGNRPARQAAPDAIASDVLSDQPSDAELAPDLDQAATDSPVIEHTQPAEASETDAAPADASSAEAASTEVALVERHETLDPGQEAQDGQVETLGGDELDDVEPRRPRSMRNYKIQEVVARRQIMLVQVVKEERGTKGAALTTYLSLAGRYCVLMPNTPRGGGVSRKIQSAADRKRLKSMLDDFDIPDGMAVIVRTAGMERSKAEIKRDYEYLLRLWDEIRETTLQSVAPALIYEEGDLIKRSIRDLYARDIDEVLVEGEEGYKTAKTFMKMIVPSHAKRVQAYRDPAVPLFHRFQVETQLDAIHSPTVQLKSGGYIVINSTEALVAIDVNSGRATRERHIEETALKTNLEAADEIARQVKLRDLAGLIVVDFIDMEEGRNNAAVERRIKEAMKNDRARIQIGRISAFGLLEMSRQRLRPSLSETSTERCPHCQGSGLVRSIDSTALHVLRGIEEEGMRGRTADLRVHVPTQVALYILNQKRANLIGIEQRYQLAIAVDSDDTLVPPDFRIERLRQRETPLIHTPLAIAPPDEAEDEGDAVELSDDEEESAPIAANQSDEGGEGGVRRRRRRRRRGRRGESQGVGEGPMHHTAEAQPGGGDEEDGEGDESIAEDGLANDGAAEGELQLDEAGQRRRRGRRGGRRRNRRGEREFATQAGDDHATATNGEDHADIGAPPDEDVTPKPVEPTHSGQRNGHVVEIAFAPRDAEQEAPPAPVPSAPAEAAAEPVAAEVAQPTAHPGIDVIVVDQPPENPKRGWWGRLINK